VHGALLTDSLEVVLPFRPEDVLAHTQRVLHFTFVASPELAASLARGGMPDPDDARAGASNGWAVAPSRSESGEPLLLANPHLPWGDLFTWYEAQLVGPGIDAYGAALVGSPLPGIAFNDAVAWTFTVNTHDGADLFVLEPADGGYLWDGRPRAFETERVALRVKQADGRVAEHPFTVARSLHGPVIGAAGGKPVALRVAGLDRSGLFDQLWRMLRANGVGDFEAALSALQLPLFTVIYADTAGHVLSVFNGQVPVRPYGDWSDWSGLIRGDTSTTLWTEIHEYSALPRVIDPASGWVQNANEPPWTTTLPISIAPENYPAYIAPPPSMSFRAQRSARMLGSDAAVSFGDLITAKFSTRAEAADHFLEDLGYAVRVAGSERARRAMDVLDAWDRNTDPSSRGAVLFEAFFDEFTRAIPRDRRYDVPWLARAPLSTPDGLGDAATAIAVLDSAARKVEATHGALDIEWGEVHRLRTAGYDQPASGGPGDIGVFRVLDFSRPGPDGRRVATGGDSWIAAIEMGAPVRAMTLLTYGNSSQPGSRHRFDQLRLYARNTLKPVWRTRAELDRHTSWIERF
jgi:acyl-homoserine-lactone acylase